MARRKNFTGETEGSTLVEFSLLAPLLFMLTVGIVELGFYYYQYQALDAATRMGARIAATRGPAITGIPDCGVAVTTAAGNYCNASGATIQWSAVCTGVTLTTTGGAVASGCDAAILGRILQEMQRVYPSLTQANIRVTFSGSNLGFVGKGRPVPLVTVEVINVTANLPVLSAFGVTGFAMPTFATSLPGEDLRGA